MNLLDFMSPAVIVAIALGLGLPAIGFVVWLVRLEGKANTNGKDIADLRNDHECAIKDLKADHAADVKEFKDELKDTRERFFKHVADVAVHHNSEAVNEFRTALERRFTGFEKSIEDIARKLNHLAARE